MLSIKYFPIVKNMNKQYGGYIKLKHEQIDYILKKINIKFFLEILNYDNVNQEQYDSIGRTFLSDLQYANFKNKLIGQQKKFNEEQKKLDEAQKANLSEDQIKLNEVKKKLDEEQKKLNEEIKLNQKANLNEEQKAYFREIQKKLNEEKKKLNEEQKKLNETQELNFNGEQKVNFSEEQTKLVKKQKEKYEKKIDDIYKNAYRETREKIQSIYDNNTEMFDDIYDHYNNNKILSYENKNKLLNTMLRLDISLFHEKIMRFIKEMYENNKTTIYPPIFFFYEGKYSPDDTIIVVDQDNNLLFRQGDDIENTKQYQFNVNKFELIEKKYEKTNKFDFLNLGLCHNTDVSIISIQSFYSQIREILRQITTHNIVNENEQKFVNKEILLPNTKKFIDKIYNSKSHEFTKKNSLIYSFIFTNNVGILLRLIDDCFNDTLKFFTVKEVTDVLHNDTISTVLPTELLFEKLSDRLNALTKAYNYFNMTDMYDNLVDNTIEQPEQSTMIDFLHTLRIFILDIFNFNYEMSKIINKSDKIVKMILIGYIVHVIREKQNINIDKINTINSFVAYEQFDDIDVMIDIKHKFINWLNKRSENRQSYLLLNEFDVEFIDETSQIKYVYHSCGETATLNFLNYLFVGDDKDGKFKVPVNVSSKLKKFYDDYPTMKKMKEQEREVIEKWSKLIGKISDITYHKNVFEIKPNAENVLKLYNHLLSIQTENSNQNMDDKNYYVNQIKQLAKILNPSVKTDIIEDELYDCLSFDEYIFRMGTKHAQIDTMLISSNNDVEIENIFRILVNIPQDIVDKTIYLGAIDDVLYNKNILNESLIDKFNENPKYIGHVIRYAPFYTLELILKTGKIKSNIIYDVLNDFFSLEVTSDLFGEIIQLFLNVFGSSTEHMKAILNAFGDFVFDIHSSESKNEKIRQFATLFDVQSNKKVYEWLLKTIDKPIYISYLLNYDNIDYLIELFDKKQTNFITEFEKYMYEIVLALSGNKNYHKLLNKLIEIQEFSFSTIGDLVFKKKSSKIYNLDIIFDIFFEKVKNYKYNSDINEFVKKYNNNHFMLADPTDVTFGDPTIENAQHLVTKYFNKLNDDDFNILMKNVDERIKFAINIGRKNIYDIIDNEKNLDNQIDGIINDDFVTRINVDILQTLVKKNKSLIVKFMYNTDFDTFKRLFDIVKQDDNIVIKIIDEYIDNFMDSMNKSYPYDYKTHIIVVGQNLQPYDNLLIQSKHSDKHFIFSLLTGRKNIDITTNKKEIIKFIDQIVFLIDNTNNINLMNIINDNEIVLTTDILTKILLSEYHNIRTYIMTNNDKLFFDKYFSQCFDIFIKEYDSFYDEKNQNERLYKYNKIIESKKLLTKNDKNNIIKYISNSTNPVYNACVFGDPYLIYVNLKSANEKNIMSELDTFEKRNKLIDILSDSFEKIDGKNETIFIDILITIFGINNLFNRYIDKSIEYESDDKYIDIVKQLFKYIYKKNKNYDIVIQFMSHKLLELFNDKNSDKINHLLHPIREINDNNAITQIMINTFVTIVNKIRSNNIIDSLFYKKVDELIEELCIRNFIDADVYQKIRNYYITVHEYRPYDRNNEELCISEDEFEDIKYLLEEKDIISDKKLDDETFSILSNTLNNRTDIALLQNIYAEINKVFDIDNNKIYSTLINSVILSLGGKDDNYNLSPIDPIVDTLKCV